MMINEAHISLSGYVATQPYVKSTRTGVPALSMRVAWTPRRMDRVTGEWVDMSTNFLTVYAYRKLAENAATCLRKGDPIVVRGRVTTRDFEDKNGHPRTALEVDAISFGHDLTRGVSTFQRVRPQTGLTANEYQEADGQPGEGGAAGAEDGAASLSGLARDADDTAFASLAAAAGDGTGSDGAAGTGGSDRTDGPGGAMFDEDAVGDLAAETASVVAPF
jgi:single-strand DNA-binding protein